VDKDLNLRPETLKLLQERIEKTLGYISMCNNFLIRTPIAHQLREMIDNGVTCNYNASVQQRKTVTRLKRHPTE
jgi:hypothetical protein